LKKGGSAVDAAIAINAALGFLEPTANGIGGDLYALLWDPKAAKVVGIAGSGRSPRGLSLETVRSRARNGHSPHYGAVTVTVPGTVDAWWRLHQRYGRLKWRELFEPAIAYAEGGVPLSPVVAYYMNRRWRNFASSRHRHRGSRQCAGFLCLGRPRTRREMFPHPRSRPHPIA
jgi:gamma-glutamyltranspeptidase/glutathione hydrolase